VSANMPAAGIGPVPESVPQSSWDAWLTQIARALNLVLGGKLNARTTLTLTASATSTTLTDTRIGPNTHIALTPLTSSATAIDIAPYISAQTKGSATISHGSSTASDLNFSALLIG